MAVVASLILTSFGLRDSPLPERVIAIALGHTVVFQRDMSDGVSTYTTRWMGGNTVLTCHVYFTLNLLQPPLAPCENLLENLRESHYLHYLSLDTPNNKTSLSNSHHFIASDHTFSSSNFCELSLNNTSNCKSIQPSLPTNRKASSLHYYSSAPLLTFIHVGYLFAALLLLCLGRSVY